MSENQIIQKQFFTWLSSTVSSSRLSELNTVFGDVDKYCIAMRIIPHPILSITDTSEINEVISTLEKDRSFSNHFKHNLSTIFLFLKLYVRFLTSVSNNSTQENLGDDELQAVPSDFTTDENKIEQNRESTCDISEEEKLRYTFILETCFSEDGYQLGRAIFRGRFKNYYVSQYGNTPEQTDEKIDNILCQIGTQRDGRVFPKQNNEHNELLNSILSDIKSVIDEGATAIYPAAVFERYRKQLADELHIYTEDALSELIREHSEIKLFKYHSHLMMYDRTPNPTEDIRRVLSGSHIPMTIEEIDEALWYITKDKIKFVLSTEKTFVNVLQGKYFFAPNFPISENEKNILITSIDEELNHFGHITDVELMRIISEKCPSLAINSEDFTKYGVRNCLAYFLGEHFSFNGPIITRIGCEINTNEVFGQFAGEREKMTYSELKEFADEMQTNIYWDAVLSEMIRLNENEFIRKDKIEFNVDEIDKILHGMFEGEYVPLGEINLFLSFPNIEYQWNNFVLESYLFNFSQKFKLIHTCFGMKETCGAIVRSESAISDYNALITDVLKKAGKIFTEKSALNYLVEKGYQARRSYKDIGIILRAVNQTSVQPQN